METKDLIIRKAVFEDWEAMYRNVWSRKEAARHMLWRLSDIEEDAREGMVRTIGFQKEHDIYTVCEKKSGQAIGYIGWEEVAPQVFQEQGIVLGPEYVGKGYGKQLLSFLIAYCRDVLGGKELRYSTRAKNEASVALALSCGFSYVRSELRTDPRSGEEYELRFYKKEWF